MGGSAMKRISLVFLALLAMGVSAHAQIQGPGGCTALAPCTVTTAPAAQTPSESGPDLLGGQATSNVITAGQCVHGCSICDISVNGFWVDETNHAAVQAAPSQYTSPGSCWSPDSGNTPYAVSVFATQTGYVSVRTW
jgi:hypothetical protein